MNERERSLFDREGWWNPACREFASLRELSRFRLELLRGWLPEGLQGQFVVDLGCGGGLLAVPLAETGAKVLGLDLSMLALRTAHARRVGNFQAVAADITLLPLVPACADLVLLADVLEHVDSPSLAVAAASRLLRPGGYLFVNTIHRTFRSWIFAIALGEGLGLIPRGTHQWSQFIKPSELSEAARLHGLRHVCSTGESAAFWPTIRRWAVVPRASSSMAVGYAALYQRLS